MKTTDATVLDEPKTHRGATRETIEPAIESRPRPTTGVKEAKIYIDGKFYSEANAKVSVFDHGLLYGDGIFEGIRFYNGRVFRLEQHLERLWDSARSICLQIPMTRQEMTNVQNRPMIASMQGHRGGSFFGTRSCKLTKRDGDKQHDGTNSGC